MRILVWHGYLLGGTGSNVYTRQLAREWSRSGNEVTVLCQEPHPERFDVGGAGVVRPDVGGLLPVFVLDHYEGYHVRLLQDCPRPELDAWVAANASTVREYLPADFVLCNHVLLGGAVGQASGARYAVKAHGSELEYSMRGRPELEGWGRKVLASATTTFVGSAHIREVVEDVCGHVDRVHEVPPGVDIEEWRPRARDEALTELVAEARRDPANPDNANERLPDEGNAERLAEFLAGDGPTVVYFGKLLLNKGVHVLLEALAGVDARAVDRRIRRLQARSSTRWLPSACSSPGRSSTGTSSTCSRSRTRASCRRSSRRPSVWSLPRRPRPGAAPLVARHSGLAEVADGLEAEYPAHLRDLASFASGDADDLRERLTRLLVASGR